LALAIVLVSAASLAAFESTIDGKWMTEMHMDSKDEKLFEQNRICPEERRWCADRHGRDERQDRAHQRR
jgi:hypothetical protein